MPTVKVNDIHMYYEIRGKEDGELVVFMPGLATDISEYEEIIRWLATTYQVLALDNRGAGRSDKPDMQYTIEMMADDAAKLLQAVGVKQAVVLGVSMGGRIALALALSHPELVKGLILVSTSAKGHRTRGRSLLIRILSIGTLIFPSKYRQPRSAFKRQRWASTHHDCGNRLHELHIPTVILHGKKDNVVPYELAEAMHNGIEGSKMVPFEGGHLFLFFKERQRFLDAVAEFLDGNG
jgi:3-oxoadipate enol-lactonase